MWKPLAVHSEGNLDVGPASCFLKQGTGCWLTAWSQNPALGSFLNGDNGGGGADQALGVQSTHSLLSLFFKYGLELFSGLGSEGSLLRPAQ